MTDGTLSLRIRGEQILLHPERAVIWPRSRTLIVADTHFGKSAYFGRHGIAVPAGSDDNDRERLDRLVRATDSRRLVILGDFLHAPLEDDNTEARDLESWVGRLAGTVDIHVVAGNHDRGHSRARPESLRWWDFAWLDPPFRCVHDANRESAAPNDPQAEFLLSGHVHPVVTIRGAPKARLRVPVFWRRATGLILPSFGQFTGGFAVRPAAGERVYVVGGNRVLPLAAVGPA